jgi:hypothetical protein
MVVVVVVVVVIIVVVVCCLVNSIQRVPFWLAGRWDTVLFL